MQKVVISWKSQYSSGEKVANPLSNILFFPPKHLINQQEEQGDNISRLLLPFFTVQIGYLLFSFNMAIIANM